MLSECRESRRFHHGEIYKFLVVAPSALGRVNIVHLYWEYDHDVDPFDLGKICILFCSDSFYAGSLSVSSVGYPAQALYYSGGGGLVEESLSLCSEERAGLGYSELRSQQWKLFYKPCTTR